MTGQPRRYRSCAGCGTNYNDSPSNCNAAIQDNRVDNSLSKADKRDNKAASRRSRVVSGEQMEFGVPEAAPETNWTDKEFSRRLDNSTGYERRLTRATGH